MFENWAHIVMKESHQKSTNNGILQILFKTCVFFFTEDASVTIEKATIVEIEEKIPPSQMI